MAEYTDLLTEKVFEAIKASGFDDFDNNFRKAFLSAAGRLGLTDRRQINNFWQTVEKKVRRKLKALKKRDALLAPKNIPAKTTHPVRPPYQRRLFF